MDSLLGHRLGGKYELLSEIGRGGMGIVYRAQDQNLRRMVAVKVLAPQLAVDPVFVQRFEQEAIAAANLHHPNIVTIHDVGKDKIPEWPGQAVHYIVMEYVEGITLEDWLRRNRRPMTVAEVAGIVQQVADALQYAHGRGMIHRDIKPSNIMLDREGHIRLMDFGLVRAAEFLNLTRSGAAIGTPQYMSPEQVTGSQIDRRTDIYSFGVVIYELLVGAVPFVRTTPMATAYAHVNESPPPVRDFRPDTPKSVEAVVAKALAKAPANRYQTAAQLATDFEIAASGKMPQGLKEYTPAPSTAPTGVMERPGKPPTGPLPSPTGEKPGRRRGMALALGAALLAVLLGGAIIVLGGGDGSVTTGSATPALITPLAPTAVITAPTAPTATSTTQSAGVASLQAVTLTQQQTVTVVPQTLASKSQSASAIAVIPPTSTPIPARTRIARSDSGASPTATAAQPKRSPTAVATPTPVPLKPTAPLAIEPLPAPELVAPPMDSSDPVSEVTFQWLSIAGAAAYKLETRSDRPGQTEWRSWDSTESTSLSIFYANHPDYFSIPGTLYYWRVVAIDNAGRVGQSSAERRFVYQQNVEAPPEEPTPTPESPPTSTPEPLPTSTPEPLTPAIPLS